MTNRVHIDAPSGIIDIEGEKDFVEGMLSRLFPVIERVGFGSRPLARQEAPAFDSEAGGDGGAAHSEQNDKPKIKRRRGANPPKGQSCADRIMSLRDDNFFKQKRVSSDIVTGLSGKGWTHKSNQVAAATEQLFKRGELQRTRDGKGPWTYYWDRN